MKKIYELAHQFAIRQWGKPRRNTVSEIRSDLAEFGDMVMSLPLASRLTAEEKERVRMIYAECELIEMDDSPNLPADRITEADAKMQVLESIFGKDFFKEG